MSSKNKTLKDLRKKYSSADFCVYDKNGDEVKHEPFIHTEYSFAIRKVYEYEEDGCTWSKEVLYIYL